MAGRRRGFVVAALIVAGVVAAWLFVGRGGSAVAPAKTTATGPSASAKAHAVAAELPSTVARPSATTPAGAASNAPSTSQTAGEIACAWGSRDGQLGRSRPQEANPEAPMSVAVTASGEVLVLDQVNGRLARFDRSGRATGSLPIALRAPQDVAVDREGTVVVLDRLGDKSVSFVDPSGREVGRLPLAGKGIPETGAVTGIFVDGKNVYAEREHGALVRIGQTDGTPGDRAEIPGRPSRDGTLYLNAGVVDQGAGRVFVSAIDRATNEHRFTRELRFPGVVEHIVLLDSDLAGIVYFATLVDRTPGTRGGETVALRCLEPTHGAAVGGAELPANTMPEETFRDAVVLDSGGVVYAVRTEQGVTYRRFVCTP